MASATDNGHQYVVAELYDRSVLESWTFKYFSDRTSLRLAEENVLLKYRYAYYLLNYYIVQVQA